MAGLHGQQPFNPRLFSILSPLGRSSARTASREAVVGPAHATRPDCNSTRDRSRRWYAARPTNAPKPTLDIKHITKNPGLYEQNCIERNYQGQVQNPWQILELSQRRKKLQHEAREKRELNNKVQAEIKSSNLVNGRDPVTAKQASKRAELISQAKQLKDDLSRTSEEENRIEQAIEELAIVLPNLSSTSTPNGEEPDTIEIVQGSKQVSDTAGPSHLDIGLELDLVDFTSAANTSGWGWYFLKNEAVLLEQALVQFALQTLLKRGWQLVSPPSMVYSHIAAACGFQPRDQNDEQQIYTLQQAAKDQGKPPLSLAATAEIPLAGMRANQTIPASALPLKAVASSRCYRAEAGARGVDTKGLYRVHEFTKVEMFAWTLPDGLTDPSSDSNLGVLGTSQSSAVFDEMVTIQREILSSLGLTFRILEMPSADLGATATRKQDIEAYFPSRTKINDGWGEVTSTSNCTDYQSRRLATRIKLESGQLDWPYTVNGTAMAIPRVLAAILESHYDSDKNEVTVPAVLHPYMAGVTKISKKRGTS